MKKDKCGFPIFDGNDLIQIMYQGNIDKIFDVLVSNDSETVMFNNYLENSTGQVLKVYDPIDLDDSEIDAVHQHLQMSWFIPEHYKNLNLSDYLLEKCNTPYERARVIDELAEFDKRDMGMLLQFMIYLVDFMKSQGIVWGVGRGSSVASYVLYLIGVHRIDSLKYDLDFKEFMR